MSRGQATAPILKPFLHWLLKTLYRVEVKGLEHFAQAGERVMVVANHTSLLDALLLGVFLPDRLTFAINYHIAKAWWVKPFTALAEVFPMDPTNPLAIKSLIKFFSENHKAVIFPEGRISVTGALMKIYKGPGLIADKANATVLLVRIDGAQYTPFSRLSGKVRVRWFPRITITVLPPRKITLPDSLRGRERRQQAGQQLTDMMVEMMFTTSNYRRTLFEALLEARQVHGGRHIVVEDLQRRPMTYNQILVRALLLSRAFAQASKPGEYVGLLLPTATGTVISFFALHACGRVPAMLNFTAGIQAVQKAIETADIRLVYTSRKFVAGAKLEDMVERLAQSVTVNYLEDLASQFTPWQKFYALLRCVFSNVIPFIHAASPDEPAVILFTSGSEGSPKGVVLSHANVLANREQVAARLDFGPQDTMLNALPLFHSFSLTVGTLLPLLAGLRIFFYPTPLHYRVIPEIAYEINATILLGTNTFLSNYAHNAHPYDFYNLRYVFSGAEKLSDETRRLWIDKFGKRIFEGYGTTETSPVLALNTPMDFQLGSVGRLVPGVDYYLEPVAGLQTGGRLVVRGPNIMRGYLTKTGTTHITPPETARGIGWYDTGDIAIVDDGFVTIIGRAKRFAKVGGEMISLTAVEELAQRVWPNVHHAAMSIPDVQKGERIVLLTEQSNTQRNYLLSCAKKEAISEIAVPRKIISIAAMPLLGSGKIDYQAVKVLLSQHQHEQESLNGGDGVA